MSNWNASDESSGSTYCEQSEKDAADAQTVADCLNIEMKRAEFQSEYWYGVFEPFLEGFSHGKTMNSKIQDARFGPESWGELLRVLDVEFWEVDF